MATAVDLLQQVAQDDEAHDFLHQDCPFFRHVGEGGHDAEGVEEHCAPARGPGRPPRLVVKLTPRTPEASTVPQPTVPPGGPGLFHHKGLQLPPYVQHLYKHLVGRYGKHDAYRVAVGVVQKWAKGIHPGGRHKGGKSGRVHADVQAAAQRNVAEWEKDKATGHEHDGDRGGREVKATAALPCTGAPPAAALSAAMLPRAQAQYGLWQHPAATVSPSPPLPPPATIPSAAEVRTLSALVPDGGDLGMSRQVRRFIETAAVKLEKNSPLDALASLRATQAAIFAAHKQDQSDEPPSGWTAAVFVPAAQSSATSSMKLSQQKALAWRKLDIAAGGLTDRIRKNYFHGIYSGPSQPARLSARLK